MKQIALIFISMAMLFLGCQKEHPSIGDPPTNEEASFTYTPSSASANIIEFSAASSDFQYIWDFGNGTKGQGASATSSYPYAGTYTVTLTVFNKGGSKSSSQQIVIAQDDLSLLNNPLFTMLTGGISGTGFKTWAVDSISSGHLGVGPDPISALGNVPEWWAAASMEKAGCGLYDDRYKFYLDGFKFDMENNGDVYVHNSLSASFPGSFLNLSDYTAPYTNQLNESWLLTEGADTTITISNNAFIGFYTGVTTYKIIDITDSTLYLQYGHSSGGLLWYLKLKKI